MLGSSWAAAQLAASQEGLSSMSEWVSIAGCHIWQGIGIWLNEDINSIFLLSEEELISYVEWKRESDPKGITVENLLVSYDEAKD
jgi:hypothetical protein